MSEHKTFYQRSEYSFGQHPIKNLTVTRQTEKCYWILDDPFGPSESRRLKESNPPLRETWEEAKQDWIDFCARKLESRERAYKVARADLDAAKALKQPEGQS